MFIEQPALAYGLVFTAEAVLFLCAAWIGARVRSPAAAASDYSAPTFGEVAMAEVMQGR